MNRRGFALLAVLWTLTAVTVLGGAAMVVARLGAATTRNRILLTRAGWAREACVEILSSRYAYQAAIQAEAGQTDGSVQLHPLDSDLGCPGW